MKKEYIGDGVYVEFDGFGIELTTERACSASATVDSIYLEPELMAKLLDYHNRALAGPEEYADGRDFTEPYGQ